MSDGNTSLVTPPFETPRDAMRRAHGDDYVRQVRRSTENWEGKCRYRAEELWRRVERRAGNRRRGRRLQQEVVRGRHRRAREAVRRENLRQGDRSADRLLQDRLRRLRRQGEQDRRALCRPRQGDLQAEI